MTKAERKAAEEAAKAAADKAAAEEAEAAKVEAARIAAEKDAAAKAEAEALDAARRETSGAGEPEGEEDQDDDSFADVFTPLVRDRFYKLFAEQLATAERDLRTGPGGLGWRSNEAKRQEVTEWHAFLVAVQPHLPK
jgi:hypothetical protein